MTVDLVCGEPAFVDLTFVGLDALPGLGEERHARDLVRSPGGSAITAIGAARLGMDVALASPIGADADGDFLRAELAREGVRWAGRRTARTAVTAVLPHDGERAMATFDPSDPVAASELAALAPRAAVLGVTRIALAPPEARVYATAGDADARDLLADGALDGADAILVNEREARGLTGRATSEEAARALAELVACAVVTLGAAGALAAAGGEVVAVAGVPVEAVDTTGAGDLFCAAFAWADAHGLGLEERLRWAVLYAALSVRVPTGTAGAATLAELGAAGARHGLTLPSGAPSLFITRRNS